MALIHAVRARIAALVGRRGWEARVDEEFRFHIEMEAERLVREGVAPEEARRRARVAFGSAESHRETMREARGAWLLEAVVRDVRHAGRSLMRSRAYAGAAILTLGLGVGVVAVMFSLVSALLFRPLPFPSSERLVAVYQEERAGAEPARTTRWSYAEYEAVRLAAGDVLELAAYNVADANVVGPGEARRLAMELVTPSYFSVLGIEPLRGRQFVDGADAAVIVSYRYWQGELAEDASVLGRTIRVNEVPLEVVGVAQPGFRGLSGEADLWVPQRMAPLVSFAEQLTIPQHFLSMVGRLRDGASRERAAAVLRVVPALDESVARGERGTPGSEWTVSVRPLEDARRPAGSVRARLVLLAAVAVLLLIAVVNLTGLTLARSVAKQRDVGVRAALGAGRWRLLQHSLAEAVLLGVAGGMVGVLLASWCVRTLPALLPAGLDGGMRRVMHVSAFAEPALDWRVLGFTFVVAGLAAMAAAVVPAVRSVRAATGRDGGPVGSTRGFAPAAGSLRRPTLLSGIIVVQVGCALVLLVGAGALLRGFQQLSGRPSGVAAESALISFRISPPDTRYDGDAAAALQQQVLEQVSAVPGVMSATVSRCTPFMRCSSTYLYEAERPAAQAPLVGRHYVGPDHFRTLGVPILQGRGLTAADRTDAPRVAVVSESAARQLWPGQDPIGRQVWFGSGRGFDSPDSPTTVVGVVADVLYDGHEPGPEFYTSYLQFTLPSTLVIVRAAVDPGTLARPLRDAVARVDPSVPVHDVRTVRERRLEAAARERFATLAVTAFAALGMLLVATGIYGVTAYSVAQRRREIAIRMALGARQSAVLRLVIGNGVTLVAAGIAAGSMAALWFARILAAFVNTAAALPLSLALAVPIMLATALLAAWLPARGAVRIDPRTQLSGD